jgi:hypothetical protein
VLRLKQPGKLLWVEMGPCDVRFLVQQGRLRSIVSQWKLPDPDVGWRGALAILRELLPNLRHEHGVKVMAVTMSTRWCHPMMVPWSDDLYREGSADAYLRARFIAVFGQVASAWHLTADDAAHAKVRLVCGIDAELVRELLAISTEHQMMLASARPAVLSALHVAQAKQGVFVIVEPADMSVCVLSRGRVVAIETQRWEGDASACMGRMWQRWRLRGLAGAEESIVHVIDACGALPDQPLSMPFAAFPVGGKHAN